MHEAIIGLFPPDAPLRIVTTNFDTHLEGALAATLRANDVQIFQAPALPLGNDFTGIVYLHGRLEPEPRKMVLTDRDFGRAYLTEGWARRFLRQLFATYDVLFVGYSHSDPVVSYLARGLPPDSGRQRFALTEDGKADHWQLLDIRPIEYPNLDRSHTKSGEILKGLGGLFTRGALAHARMVQELINRGPSNLKADERDYLLFILKDPQLRHLFFDYSKDSEWLRWMDGLNLLIPLFEPLCEDDLLIYWFVRDPLGERGETALAVLGRKSFRFTSRMFQIAIAREILHDISDYVSKGLSQEDVRRLMLWITVLLPAERLDQTAAQFLGYLLKKLPLTTDTLSVHLLVFQTIIRPRPELRERSYRLGDEKPVELQIEHAGDRHTIDDIWTDIFQPNLRLLASELLSLLTEVFLTSQSFLQGVGQSSCRFDILSFGRSAIEPHEQNQDYLVTHVLIDAARDSLAYLNQSSPKQARIIIEDWIRSKPLVLRRLAIHGMKGNSDLSVRQKVRLITSSPGLLRYFYADHEICHTLRHCYEKAGLSVRKEILVKKRRSLRERYEPSDWPDKEPEILKTWESREWLTFLFWLEETASGCDILSQALKKARKDSSKVEPDTEHPDFRTWSQSGWVESVSPLSQEEIRQLSPVEVLRQREALAPKSSSFGVDEIQGFDKTVEQVASSNFSWGLELARHLTREVNVPRKLWGVLFRAWRQPESARDDLSLLLSFLLANEQLLRDEAGNIASFLEERFQSGKSKVERQTLELAIKVAVRLWPLLDGSCRLLSGNDLYLEVMNNPVGCLGLFCISALSRQSTDFKRGLVDTPELEQLLDLIVADVDGERVLGTVALAAQLPFLMAVAPDWTSAKLMPLLSWNRNESTALALWTGYFQSNRLPRLTDSFLSELSETFERLDRFDQRTRRQVPKFVTALLQTQPDALSSDWLAAFLRCSTDQERYMMWSQLRFHLQEAEEGDQKNSFDEMWESWGRDLVKRRLTGGPDLENEEWEAIVELCPRCAASFSSCVDIIERRQQAPRFEHRIDVLYHLGADESDAKLENPWKEPQVLVRYLLYILSAQNTRGYWLADLRNILLRLKRLAHIDSGQLSRLFDRYVELGGRAEDLVD